MKGSVMRKGGWRERKRDVNLRERSAKCHKMSQDYQTASEKI